MKPICNGLANSQVTPCHQKPGASWCDAFTTHIRLQEPPLALLASTKGAAA